MSNGMTSHFSYRLYPIEKFGLKMGECESIIAQLNGCSPSMDGPLPEGYLAFELRMAAASSAADHARFGRDLSYPKHDSPEMPKELLTIAEKISKLAPWQQDAITFYVLGFWGGIGAAARQQEKTEDLHNSAPPGWDKV